MKCEPSSRSPRHLLRSVLASLAIAVGTASVVHAAPSPDAAQRGDRQGNGERRGPLMQVFEDYRTLIESLKLDGDQSRQLRDVMQSTRESMRSLAQDAQTMSPQDRLASFNEALDTMNGKIGGLLNDEQKKTFEKGTADIREKAIENFKQQAGRPNRDGATTGPSTRPGGGPGGPGGGPGGPGGGLGGGRMERVQKAMDDAGLTDEQKEKMKPLLDEAREKMRTMITEARDKGAVDPQAMREKMREVYDDVAKKAADFLSAEQVEKLKTALQQRPGGQGGGQSGGRGGPNGGSPNAGGDAPKGDAPKGDGPNGDGPKGDNPPPPPPGDKPAAAGPASPASTAMDPTANPEAGNHAGLAASAAQPKQTSTAGKSGATTKPSTVALGEPLPAFTLTKLDGHAESNQTLAHKPSVIIFGSYTAPSFRDHVPLILQLAKRYSTRVNWLIIYTREMHPAGVNEPERNRDDNITIAAHKTIADRIAAAKTAKVQLQINIDIAPDLIDDAFTNACGGFPNGSLLVDGNGNIAARQEWADAFALERAIDRELKRK